MSSRPWLEALKVTMRERGAATEEAPEKMSETLSLEGCKRCESLADRLPPTITDNRIAKKVCGSWGEEERRLMYAGWKPKERGDLLIWASPQTGFYCSQEVALHRLKQRGDAL